MIFYFNVAVDTVVAVDVVAAQVDDAVTAHVVVGGGGVAVIVVKDLRVFQKLTLGWRHISILFLQKNVFCH